MLYSKPDQQRLAQLCDDHFRPALGPKAATQLRRAVANPPTWFADTVLRPALYRADILGAAYIPVSLDPFSLGRNHHLAEAITKDPDPLAVYGGDPITGLTFFANSLRTWGLPGMDDGTHGEVIPLDPPKNRVTLGNHQVFTYEFDVADPEFLKFQFSWLRSSKSKLDSPIGAMFRYCSGFADFAGITVCYSGNKSFHLHLVFGMALANARFELGGLPSTDLRQGLVAHWEKLHEPLVRILDVGEHRADQSLRFPESFRRVPNGVRPIDNDQHLLGIPKGTLVPQVTLWEHSRGRAAADTLPLFFTPEAFHAQAALRKVPRATAQTIRVGEDLSDDERQYCEEQLRRWYPEWPRFDYLAFEGGRWVAKFRNSTADATPSSFMREDFRTIRLMGRDAEHLKPEPMPFNLGVMLTMWRGEHRGQQDLSKRLSLEDVLTEVQGRSISLLERRFRARVKDSASAKVEMEAFFRITVTHHPLLLAVGPEGVGKTSVLMALHHELADDLQRRGESTLALYACADYDAATKKCADFNALQGPHGFVGVVLPSFSRAYEEACAATQVKSLSTEDAARSGFPSRLAAIKALQPEVIDAFRVRHANLWARVGDRSPVFFAVHQVAHEWKRNSPTRLMWAPSYWSAPQEDAAERSKLLRCEMRLGLLVHDEVKADSLTEMRPDAVIWWVDALVNTDTAVWSAEHPSLPKLLASFEAYLSKHGYPVVDGRIVTVAFDEVRRIVEHGTGRWDHVVTVDTGEYGVRSTREATSPDDEADCSERKDIYGGRHGRHWQVLSREWWHGVADRVVLLTTEAVPTAVARRADPEWAIYELETPLLPRDAVSVHSSRHVRGDNLATLCATFRGHRLDDDYAIVSNRAAMMADCMTHMAARGSNDLIGRNVLQTMTYMTPDEYERLQALNAWTGRQDLVGLRHIDEFNQTAGRNLGFRRQGRVKHDLLVNLSLFELLVTSGVMGRARYEMQVMLDRHQRYEAKRAAG